MSHSPSYSNPTSGIATHMGAYANPTPAGSGVSYFGNAFPGSVFWGGHFPTGSGGTALASHMPSYSQPGALHPHMPSYNNP